MKRTIFAVLLIIFSVVSYPQHRNDKRHHAFSGTLVLGVDGGATAGYTDYKELAVDYTARGILEYFFSTNSASSFGIRLFGGGGYLRGKDNTLTPDEFRTDLVFSGGELVYNLSLGDAVFPYLAAGASYIVFNPKTVDNIKLPNNAAGAYKKNDININGEFGFRILLSDDLSLNLSSAVFINPNDNLDDNFTSKQRSNDIFFTAMAGLSFSFFRTSDIDEDGIYDDDDNCPEDSEDFDGYEDDDGCPDMDDDSDQINDQYDDCPGQKEDFDGYRDNDGCPDLDNDNDGMMDNEDMCANQEEDFDGYEDMDGCPEPDNDKDGLLDINDECPDIAETKNGYEDEDGCPDEKPVVETPKEIILSGQTNFAAGKAELNPSAYSELEKIVKVMLDSPTSKWRIEGHTDSKGSDKLNKKLSLARANAVMEYFIGRGLESHRFEVIGLGEDVPVADNSTEEGRIKNRRVKIFRIN